MIYLLISFILIVFRIVIYKSVNYKVVLLETKPLVSENKIVKITMSFDSMIGQWFPTDKKLSDLKDITTFKCSDGVKYIGYDKKTGWKWILK